MIASQFQTAQNWALGSAMAMSLIGMILASVAAMGLLAWLVTAALTRRYRVKLDVPGPARVVAS
jgi:spermidine/putrescine transport system permease protein